MYTGGSHNTPQAARTIRYAGLIIPIVLAIYGYMHSFGLISSKNYAGFEVLTAIVGVWMIVGLLQFLFPAKHRLVATIRLTLYHILSAAYLLLVTGIVTPFIAFWIVLIIASYLYFDRRGVLASIGVFMVTVCIDMVLRGTQDASTIPYDLAVLVAILLSGLIVMSINRAQAVDQVELQRSHAQEILQRDRILTIVNNLADAILSTDKNGIIRVYNAASLDLLDTNDSLNGHHIDTILPLKGQDGETITLSELFKDVSSVATRDDVWYVFEDGERVRLEVTVSPIRKTFKRRAPGQDGYIVILRDITRAKSLEEERDEFISVVSHELRTPVTVVEGSLSNLELMLDKVDIGKDRVAEAVAMAHKQTLYLAKMVNDLSALSRAERGVADEQEIIDVQQLIKSMYDTYISEAKAKHLSLDLDVGTKLGKIEVSRLYIEELLQNFITNAIKYTKDGGVTVSAHRKGDEIIFAVKDTGIGISKTEQAKVFDKFYRSEDYRTRETGGTGLGLYVAGKLARKLGTEVNLTSRLNYGSTFSFSIPLLTETSTKNR
jgi:PAS domain S-box-containing protein